MAKPLLQAKCLQKYYPVSRGLAFAKTTGWIRAVDSIDFAVNEAETLGVVGETGCGKTTTAKLVLLLERPTGGSLLFMGEETSQFGGEALARYRRSVQAVFQDPFSSLNPRMKVGEIVAEPLIAAGAPKAQIRDRVAEVLRDVGLAARSDSLYPHEFSGGQRQRIALARALAPQPKCVVLDEPVSALDVSIRAQIVNLLRELQDRFGFSYLVIAHDLAAVRYLSTTIAVMYVGKIVEMGATKQLYAEPVHPYTRALMVAMLPSHPRDRHHDLPLQFEVPNSLNPPSGCRFHPRCDLAKGVCREAEPALVEVSAGRHVACHLYGDGAGGQGPISSVGQ